MKVRLLLILLVAALLVGACGADFGVGLPACEDVVRRPTAATILTAQAVPTARFGPCIEELELGWDNVEFTSRNGLAELVFSRAQRPFLVVRLQESCGVDPAHAVPSGIAGIARYEDVEAVEPEIGVTLVPSSQKALIYARTIVDNNTNIELEGRVVVFEVDEDIEQSLRARTNRALFGDNLVMILTEVDVEERTVDLRIDSTAAGRRLSVDEAMDAIEASVPEVMYRGRWAFVFDGGCITYDFDASGRVAEGLSFDADERARLLRPGGAAGRGTT